MEKRFRLLYFPASSCLLDHSTRSLHVRLYMVEKQYHRVELTLKLREYPLGKLTIDDTVLPGITGPGRRSALYHENAGDRLRCGRWNRIGGLQNGNALNGRALTSYGFCHPRKYLATICRYDI